jgi:hypothetical protein
LHDLARAHAPEAIKELAGLAKDAKRETARIAVIKELLDRAYGKVIQYVAAENDEPALNDLNLEELRAAILANRCHARAAGRYAHQARWQKAPEPRRAVVLSGRSFVKRADRGFRQQRVTRSKAHVRALVHSTRPFRKGLCRSGLPPSRIPIFRERLINRLRGLSCWLA